MKGIYAAELTPFREDLSVDHEELARHCFDLVKRGCTGIALFGTTGEGPSFSFAERKETLERLLSARFDARKLIVANGSATIPETAELARMAMERGCAAMLISPPSFYKNVKEEGVIAYYRAIVERAGHPGLRILLYHYPQMTGVPITLGIIAALRKEFPDVVIGLKESEANLPFSKAILAQFPGFQLFVGKEMHIVEVTKAGGAGSICGIGNLYPEEIIALYVKADPTAQRKIEAFARALEGYPFIPAAKTVMEERRGAHWHSLRPPLVPLTAAERQAFLSRL